MNSCCINLLSEVNCPTPNGKAIWFKCRYAACHGGVGHVVVTAADGTVVYDGDPTVSTSKYIYIDFDTAKVNSLGASMDVTYKPGDAAWGSHTCKRATFDWGYAGNEQLVVGTAYLDNTGGVNDLGNTCGSSYTRCNTFQIPVGAFTTSTNTSPVGFYAKTRKVCFIGNPTCSGGWAEAIANAGPGINFVPAGYKLATIPAGKVCFIGNPTCSGGWTEAIANAGPGINFVPAGYKLATIPAGKSLFLTLINYNARGIAYTAPGAELNITSAGQILATIPLTLQSNGAPVSPYPFDGVSIDGSPFKITNTWTVPVDVVVGTGLVNFPGIYNGLAGIRVDDSLAYIIS